MSPPTSSKTLPESALETKDYYRPDIDGLRGIAVTLVVLYHFFPHIFKNGFLGVDIFFVISGFVVTQALKRKLNQDALSKLLNFYAHRVKRILPALYINILATVVLSCLIIPSSDLRSIFKTAAAAIVGLGNLALLYARFDYFNPDLALNPFIHTWSLGVEEQFYFIFPLLFLSSLYLLRSQHTFHTRHILILLGGFSLLYWLYLFNRSPVSAFYNPLARFWELLLGSILALYQKKLVSFMDGKLDAALQYFGVTLLIASLIVFPMLPSQGYLANLFATFGSFLIIGTGVSFSSIPSRLLKLNFLVWTGRISYSLYLWHYPLFTFLRWNSDPGDSYFTVIALLLAFALAYLSYRFIEIPFRYRSLSGARALFSGMATGLTCLLLVYAIYHLPPSRIYLGHAEYFTNLWPSENTPLTQSLNATQRNCHLQYLDHLTPGLISRCSTEDKNQNFIYLIGNSHAQHLIPMLEVVSRHSGYGYTALTISNCRLISAVQVISTINYRYDLCKEYFDYLTEFIIKNAKNGDFVLIGNRSFFEKPESGDENKDSNILLDERTLTAKEVYEKSMSDLDNFSKKMSSKGVSIILTGPTPSFPIPATQCVPEWFRKERPECKVDRRSLSAERDALFRSVSKMIENNRNIYFWDPSVALCDQTYCLPFREGKLLFRDEHHLSLYGSESLSNSFLQVLDRIQSPLSKSTK